MPGIIHRETKRALGDRIKEHRDSRDKKSVVSLHQSENQGHNFNFDKVQILDKESCYKKRILSEMLHINSCNNTINKKEDTQFLNRSYFNILNVIQCV